MSKPEPGTPEPEQKGLSPISNILIGLFLVVAGTGLFFYFMHLETTGKSESSTNAVVALLYNVGGKWLVAVVCWLIGAGFLIGGIVGLVVAGGNSTSNVPAAPCCCLPPVLEGGIWAEGEYPRDELGSRIVVAGNWRRG